MYESRLAAWKPLSVAALTLALVSPIAVPAGAVITQPITAIPVIAEQDNFSLQGTRLNATGLPVPVNDMIGGRVDVGTGNLNLSIQALGFSFTKNSLDATETGQNLRQGWRTNVAGAGSLSTRSNQVVWTTGTGYEVPFTPVDGSGTAFTSPTHIHATLVKTSTGWDMRHWSSNTVTSYNNDGQATGFTDRNGNKTALGLTGGLTSSVTSWAGPTGSRTTSLTAAGNVYTVARSTLKVTLEGDGTRLTKITGLNGAVTTITYQADGRVASIQAPATGLVSFVYDAQGRITQIKRANAKTGEQVTRLNYTDGTRTLVAGAMTDQTKGVDVVPHTTYVLNASKLVTQATDADGRVVSRTFNPNQTVASSTVGTGADAATSTNTYNANGGYSLTQSTSATGATGSADYTGTTDATKYSPTSGTDDAGNKSTYTYSAAGNMESATNALAAVAKLTYNQDGTVATATAPGQDGNPTRYTYNADHQLIKVTPNTGGSLKAESYTYDSLGRLGLLRVWLTPRPHGLWEVKRPGFVGES